MGKKEWSDLEDTRKEAELKAVIDELLRIDAIQPYGTAGYKFTGKGFKMFERLTQIA